MGTDLVTGRTAETKKHKEQAGKKKIKKANAGLLFHNFSLLIERKDCASLCISGELQEF
ncbi:MAG: hypothetical protein WDO16_17130 [Bacteroidota bacterium]